MLRKSLIFPLLLIASVIWFADYCRPFFIPNTYVSGWGAISKDQEYMNTTQTITFNATIKNNGHYPVYVKDVEVNFLESIKSNFQSGDRILAVGKWLKPSETSEVNGEWLFNTSGIKANNIMQSAPNFATFQIKMFP